jgi:hypothetical protein
MKTVPAGQFKNSLKNSVIFEKNIVDPLGIEWDAEQ